MMSISPSLPGMFGRSFDITCVTLASWATSEAAVRHATTKTAFVKVINYLSLDRRYSMRRGLGGTLGGLSEPRVEARLAELRVIARNQCSLADFRAGVKRI